MNIIIKIKWVNVPKSIASFGAEDFAYDIKLECESIAQRCELGEGMDLMESISENDEDSKFEVSERGELRLVYRIDTDQRPARPIDIGLIKEVLSNKLEEFPSEPFEFDVEVQEV